MIPVLTCQNKSAVKHSASIWAPDADWKGELIMRFSIAISALLAASALGLQAQQVEGKAKIGDSESKAKVSIDQKNDREHRDRLSTDENAGRIKYREERRGEHRIVQKVNKGSGVIGMEVKNHLGERVGEIQDIVVDLPSGKISYVVLSVGGFLGIGEKYIAVPPNAFHAADAENQLVLNVDKAKVQAAPGFAKTSWPDLDNPAWGAASEWGRDNDAEIRARADLNTHDRDRGVEAKSKFDTRDGKGRFESREKGTARHSDELNVFRGKITSVDVEHRTITVTGESGKRTFMIDEKPMLTLKSNRNPTLSDFKVGYPVRVEFDKHGDSYMAHTIVQADTPEVK
jgi:sporulation protein YlmC with PRC-barrel domain